MVDKITYKSIQASSATSELKINTSTPIPVPKDGEVLVKVLSAAIQPSDALKSTPYFGPVEYPVTLGLEGYGQVLEDKSNSDLKGKFVAFWSVKATTWAEYSVVPVTDLIVTPEYKKEDFGKAAYFFLNPITALGLFETIKQKKAKAFAFNAAFSHVGQILINLAKAEGIKTVAITRKDDQTLACKNLGADVSLNSASPNYLIDLKNAANSLGVTVFLDCVGGAETAKGYESLPEGASIVTYGGLAGSHLDENVKSELAKKYEFSGFFFLVHYYYNLSGDEKKKISEKIAKELDSTYKASILKGIKLDEVPKEFSDYLSNMSKGKLYIEL